METVGLTLINAINNMIHQVGTFIIPLEIMVLVILRKRLYQREILINLSCGAAILLFFKVVDCSYAFRAVQYFRDHALITFNTENSAFGSVLFWVAHIVVGDFCFYIFHRMVHTKYLFMVEHSVHHSSTELNYTTNIRISFLAGLYAWTPLVIPAWLGFNPALLFACFGLANGVPFFLHRERSRKWGWLEYILNTPTHHRVHHGCNPCYIDKNFGGMLIIWDRLLGTFAEETEPVIFGVRGLEPSPNPLVVLFRGWLTLFKELYALIRRYQLRLHTFLALGANHH